jgi:hypothetical protein
MSSDGIGENSDTKSDVGDNDPKGEPPVSIAPPSPKPGNEDSDQHGNRTRHVYLKRDCIDYINTTVVTLAFAAAVYAGSEAKRLADLTQIAISNADNVAKDQATDTATALSLSKQAADAALKQATAAERQVYVLRANMRQDAIEPQPIIQGNYTAGWNMTPVWHNIGGTDATNVAAWWKIFVLPRNQISISNCPTLTKPPGSIPPASVPPGGQLAQVSQILTADQAISATGISPSAIIYIADHIEYGDIFPDTPIHILDWCVNVIPNDIRINKFSYLNMYHISSERQKPSKPQEP